MRIRRAAAADVVALRHRVLRPGRPVETAHFSGDEDPKTRHWVAESTSVLGVASVMYARCPVSSDADWQLRGMAVHPDHHGRQIGSQLLTTLASEVGEPLWCNARESAQRFYQRAGWVIVSPSFDVPHVGPHRRMLFIP